MWAAVDIRLDRPVAVKVLDGAASSDRMMLRALDQEARTLARLQHPNIVAVYDLGAEDDVQYVVMELVEGDDLHQRLALRALAVPEAVGIASQICDALGAAHHAGVVHRDIKPDNILLTPDGVVKLCDFGIARLQLSTQVGRTARATAIGTALYMAPEQATTGDVDARTDLYGLGCVLYAMLTGAPPFAGDNPMRVLWQQVHDTAVPVGARRPDVPPGLEALVAELLAKNPADRPADAGLVRRRLAPFANVAPVVPAVQPAPGSTALMHGRAAVKPRTMAMPAVEVGEQHEVSRGFRLGPVGIAVVAIGVAIATALVIVPLINATPPKAQTTTSSQGVTTSPVESASPTTTLDDVRAVIQDQVAAGELDAGAANDLLATLDSIDRDLAKGQTSKAADKIGQLHDQLNDLANDGKITDAGYTAILASLDQLTNASTTPGDQ